MKVLEINAFHYRRGGSESVFFRTSELLRANGDEVVEFTLRWPENLPSPQEQYFAESKETRRGPLRGIRNIVSYFYHFEAARNLDLLLRREKPDVAQVHLIWGQLTPSILSVLRRHGVPVVLTLHDFRLVCPASVMFNGKGRPCEECEGRRFTRCIANNCCKGSKGLSAMMAAEQYFRNAFFRPSRLVDGVLYVSDFSQRTHLKYMPSLAGLPSARIYNTAPHIADRPTPPSARDPYWLYFGRLSREKGVETLVEAFAKMPHRQLTIAGTGPLADQLRHTVESRGLDNIRLLGFVGGQPLQQLVAEARFVVVPSECFENNPLAVVEAYAEGTPVIGAEIGGIPEIVENGSTGITFESGDVDSLVGAVETSAGIPAGEYAAMQERALEFARRNFNVDGYYPRLADLLGRAIAHRKAMANQN